MLHRFRFVIVGILIILVNQAVTFAVSASMPNALLPDGSTRYAAVYATSTEFSLSPSWQDMPDMTKYITIPTGQTADVMVIFCGSSFTGEPAYLSVRALIRDVLASPSEFQLQVSDTAGRSSHCAIFLKTNVTAGSPAVKIQWDEAGRLSRYSGPA